MIHLLLKMKQENIIYEEVFVNLFKMNLNTPLEHIPRAAIGQDRVVTQVLVYVLLESLFTKFPKVLSIKFPPHISTFQILWSRDHSLNHSTVSSPSSSSHPTKASCVFIVTLIIFISPPFWTSILTCSKSESFELPLLTKHSQEKIKKSIDHLSG